MMDWRTVVLIIYLCTQASASLDYTQNCTQPPCHLRCPLDHTKNETCTQYCNSRLCTQFCSRESSCKQICAGGACAKMECRVLSQVPEPGKMSRPTCPEIKEKVPRKLPMRDTCYSECKEHCPDMYCYNQAACKMVCVHDNCSMNCDGGECYQTCKGKGCQMDCHSLFCEFNCQQGYCKMRISRNTKYNIITCPRGYCDVLCPLGRDCKIWSCPYNTCKVDFVKDPFNPNSAGFVPNLHELLSLGSFALMVMAVYH